MSVQLDFLSLSFRDTNILSGRYRFNFIFTIFLPQKRHSSLGNKVDFPPANLGALRGENFAEELDATLGGDTGERNEFLGDGERDALADRERTLTLDVTGEGERKLALDGLGDGERILKLEDPGDGERILTLNTSGDGERKPTLDSSGDGECKVILDISGDGERTLILDASGDGESTEKALEKSGEFISDETGYESYVPI